MSDKPSTGVAASLSVAIVLAAGSIIYWCGQATATAQLPAQSAPIISSASEGEPKPKRHQYTGLVAAIGYDDHTITVTKQGAESKTFQISDKTRYSTAEKKKAELKDIKIGGKITVTYTEDRGVLTAHRIGVPQSVRNKE